jgi:hypothetical protein
MTLNGGARLGSYENAPAVRSAASVPTGTLGSRLAPTAAAKSKAEPVLGTSEVL